MKGVLVLTLVVGFVGAGCGKKEPAPAVDDHPLTQSNAGEVLKTAVATEEAAVSSVPDKDKAQAVIGESTSVVEKGRPEWRLSERDIKADLEKSGQLVREKPGAGPNATVDDVRVVAVINGKFGGDQDLSTLKIDIDSNGGVVTLKGSANSVELVGRATALALDTDGVTRVVSQVRVDP